MRVCPRCSRCSVASCPTARSSTERRAAAPPLPPRQTRGFSRRSSEATSCSSRSTPTAITASTRLRARKKSNTRARPGPGSDEVVEREVVAGAQQRALDALEHLAEEPAVHERDDHADVLRAARDEARGIGRRDVADLGGGRLDPAARVVGDVAAAREGPRGGGLRDAREARDIADGGHQRLPPSGCSDAECSANGERMWNRFLDGRRAVLDAASACSWERSLAQSAGNHARCPNRDLPSLVRNRRLSYRGGWNRFPASPAPHSTRREKCVQRGIADC